MNKITKKVIKIASVAIFITVICILAYISLKVVTDKESFKIWMDSHQILGKFVFIGMVILQIMVAIVPGGPIEIAGGYAFGAVEGTIFFIIGATIGSLLVFLLVRKFGRNLVELYFEEHEIKKLDFLKNDEKRDMLFMILFVIPGTPKDLLCYVAGLTKMKLGMFLVISSIGRLPAVIGSAVSGSALSNDRFITSVIAFAVTVILSGVGILIYYRIVKSKQKNDNQNKSADL